MSHLISRFSHSAATDIDDLRPSEHCFSPFPAALAFVAAPGLISTVLMLIAQA
jgi:hypothetical protein